jgi:transcriptional regulator with XRE-family HTH domain
VAFIKAQSRGNVQMLERIREIAARVRELREDSGFTEESLAARVGLPIDRYRQYENGSEDFPASILFEIAQVLNVDLGVLLTGDASRMHVFTVTRAGKGVDVERRNEYEYQALAMNFIHKKAEPFLITVEPRADGAKTEVNAHPGQEFDFVIEGTLRVFINQQEIVLEAGDSIFFDSGYGHAMEAVGERPARFLAVIM